MRGKIVLSFMAVMLCGVITPLNTHATDKTKEEEFPTVEELMKDYEISEDEATILLKGIINESKSNTTRTVSVKSMNSPEAEQRKQVLETEAMAEISRLESSPIQARADVKRELTNNAFFKQENSYYCGPAATRMALAARQKESSYSQKTLAGIKYLETDSLGYTPGSYIKYTLNLILGKDWYVYREVNSDNAADLRYRVKLNVDSQYAPVAAIYQNGTDSRTLVGHTKASLRHFITITGYNTTKKQTYYSDSASGLGGRFANVPKRSWISDSTLSYLMWDGSMIY